MEGFARRSEVDGAAETTPLRRILITVGLVLAVLILVAVAIYAGAFIMLAPMMQ